MTAPKPQPATVAPWSGRRVTAALAYVLHRDKRRCWLCNHDGANSLDHVQPRETHPELTWTPTNWRAAHLARAGHPKGCPTPGCKCPGNSGRRTTPPIPSRKW